MTLLPFLLGALLLTFSLGIVWVFAVWLPSLTRHEPVETPADESIDDAAKTGRFTRTDLE